MSRSFEQVNPRPCYLIAYTRWTHSQARRTAGSPAAITDGQTAVAVRQSCSSYSRCRVAMHAPSASATAPNAAARTCQGAWFLRKACPHPLAPASVQAARKRVLTSFHATRVCWNTRMYRALVHMVMQTTSASGCHTCVTQRHSADQHCKSLRSRFVLARTGTRARGW